ncbi:hypothetical protein [Dysgonomonas sp. 25]|uniref:hypothetical protein n=1 Tax=Dysgonomonas sp. 25 TaxID=2302933 RepID=UPI0013CF536D|nr:hypothetical protein [Dysgonomonas sp. 25]NDV67344.1 hypothetical protein [Dysgonomonas sp. 25]
MKKILFILLTAITLVSCTGEDGRDGRDANFFTKTVTIKSEDWVLSGTPGSLSSNYYADVHIPELTYSVYDYGAVVAYLIVDDDVKNVMPFVLHKGIWTGTEAVLWTQTYDYEIEPNWMRFYVTYSDFDTYQKPDTESFQIVLMW